VIRTPSCVVLSSDWHTLSTSASCDIPSPISKIDDHSNGYHLDDSGSQNQADLHEPYIEGTAGIDKERRQDSGESVASGWEHFSLKEDGFKTASETVKDMTSLVLCRHTSIS